MIVGRRSSPCQARFREPSGDDPFRSGPGSAGWRRNLRNRRRAGARRGSRRLPKTKDPGTTKTAPPLAAPFRPGAPFPLFPAARIPAARKTRRAPPPVLPGRVAGGIREGESQWNPGGPAGGRGSAAAERPERGSPLGRREEGSVEAAGWALNQLPPWAAGRKAGLPRLPVVVLRVVAPPSGAGKKGGLESGGAAGSSGIEGNPGRRRAVAAAGEHSRPNRWGEPGTPNRGRRTGSPSLEGRSPAVFRASRPRRKEGGVPDFRDGGDHRVEPEGRRVGGRGREFVPVPGSSFRFRGVRSGSGEFVPVPGSSFRFRGSFGAGPPSFSGVGESGVGGSGVRFDGEAAGEFRDLPAAAETAADFGSGRRVGGHREAESRRSPGEPGPGKVGGVSSPPGRAGGWGGAGTTAGRGVVPRPGGSFGFREVRSGSGRFVRCGISFGFRGSGVRNSGVRGSGVRGSGVR